MENSCMQIGSTHLPDPSFSSFWYLVVLGCCCLPGLAWVLSCSLRLKRQVYKRKLMVFSVIVGIMCTVYIVSLSWASQQPKHFTLDCDIIQRLPRMANLTGDGTWAEVYLTHWQRQLLAIKVMRTRPRRKASGMQPTAVNAHYPPGCSPEAHLRNEGEISGLFIGNPHVVQRVGYCRAIPAIVYNYYPLTLLELLFNGHICPGSDWSLDLIIGLSAGVARSVEALHQARWGPVVHAEINPGQFLIDEIGTIRIADFHHSTHPVMGQANDCKVRVGGRYIAPEQVQDKDITPATDIYAMGLVIWTIATREYAFDGLSKQEVWKLVLKNKRPSIPALVPQALVEIIQACWMQTPDDRPSATVVREKLERLEKLVRKS